MARVLLTEAVLVSLAMTLDYYSLHPKLLECFDWNTNIKEFVRNLQKCPTRI
jgi:hypothetical protein